MRRFVEQQETDMKYEPRFDELTNDDLESVNGGETDLGKARTCCNVALAFQAMGSNEMTMYFLGMACSGYGWC